MVSEPCGSDFELLLTNIVVVIDTLWFSRCIFASPSTCLAWHFKTSCDIRASAQTRVKSFKHAAHEPAIVLCIRDCVQNTPEPDSGRRQLTSSSGRGLQSLLASTSWWSATTSVACSRGRDSSPGTAWTVRYLMTRSASRTSWRIWWTSKPQTRKS